MTVANYESIDSGAQSKRLPGREGEYDGTRPYRRRWEQLEREAAPYLPVWQILNEFMHPWSGRYLWGDKEREQIIRGYNIQNAVVGDAARTCASGLHGGLTSPSKPWFEVTHPHSQVMEDSGVKMWMHQLQEIMRSVLAKSNFYSVMPNLYMEAIIYGPAAAIVDPDSETGVRLRPLTIGEFYLALGGDLRVNTLYRRLEMTPAQMREKFGEDNPGFNHAVRHALERGNLDHPTFTIIHAMQPSGMFGGKVRKEFKYESVYFMLDSDDPKDQAILLWRGHRSCPFVAVRWSAVSDDAYGFSPGMQALADDRMLQNMELDYIKAVEMTINPPVTGPASLDWELKEHALPQEGIKPGTFVPHANMADAPAMRPIYQVNFDFNNTRIKIQDVVGQIQNKFYNHLFLSILFNTKQMTATEVAQRLEEKAMVLGPVLERFQSELFDPFLDRVFNILYYEFGIIEEPPDEITGNNLKIDYIGTLAQSVKMLGLTNITNVLPIVAEMLKLDPSAIVKLNIRELIDYVTTTAGWPPAGTRSDEECAQIDEARAQAEQQAAAMQQAEQAASAAKMASETPLSNGSLLTGAEGGIQELDHELGG